MILNDDFVAESSLKLAFVTGIGSDSDPSLTAPVYVVSTVPFADSSGSTGPFNYDTQGHMSCKSLATFPHDHFELMNTLPDSRAFANSAPFVTTIGQVYIAGCLLQPENFTIEVDAQRKTPIEEAHNMDQLASPSGDGKFVQLENVANKSMTDQIYYVRFQNDYRHAFRVGY